MKSLNEIINEEKDDWKFMDDIHGMSRGIDINIKNAKYLLINLDNKFISPITDSDLKSFTKDFGDDTVEKEVKKLKLGESYDADGGINIYLRIK